MRSQKMEESVSIKHQIRASYPVFLQPTQNGAVTSKRGTRHSSDAGLRQSESSPHCKGGADRTGTMMEGANDPGDQGKGSMPCRPASQTRHHLQPKRGSVGAMVTTERHRPQRRDARKEALRKIRRSCLHGLDFRECDTLQHMLFLYLSNETPARHMSPCDVTLDSPLSI